MIKPTVGRNLLFYPGPEHTGRKIDDKQPFIAFVAYVHADDRINIAYHDHHGSSHKAENVKLVEDNSDGKLKGVAGWMPYQNQQAKGEIPPTLHADPAKGNLDEIRKMASAGAPLIQRPPKISTPAPAPQAEPASEFDEGTD